MYKNILVPTDGSPLARAAAEKSIQLAKLVGAKVTVFFAAPAATPIIFKGLLPKRLVSTTAHEELVEKAAAKHLGYVEDLAKKAGVPCKTTHRTDDFPATAILATAKKEKCDLICMASHGHTGFRNSLLGSQTSKVLSESPIPVLVHR